MSLIDDLPPILRTAVKVRALDAGEVLFRQGDRAFALFEVEWGRLRLVRHADDGGDVVLHTAGPGGLFAEAAMFSPNYQCDAVALVPSRVRAYPKPELLAAFRSDPVLAERFMAVMARQIHVLRARLEERNIRSARGRILHRLAFGAADGRTMPLDGTLMDLAAELGLTHEALYRTLAALEREGVIARSRTGITLRKRSPV